MKQLKITDLQGGYDGLPILEQVSFQVNAGEIVGLIGPNGSGKTTLLKTMLGILPSQGGNITLDQQELTTNQMLVQQSLAYIPEIPFLYEELTLQEHMEFSAMSNGLTLQAYEKQADFLLKLFQMKGKEAHFPGSFSKGMKQKVMVMCALLQKPQLLIVDEPFIGLDPKAIKNFTEMLKTYASQGMGILMSTHVLDAAERICDRFVILNQGRVIFEGTLEALRDAVSMKTGTLLTLFDAFVEETE